LHQLEREQGIKISEVIEVFHCYQNLTDDETKRLFRAFTRLAPCHLQIIREIIHFAIRRVPLLPRPVICRPEDQGSCSRACPARVLSADPTWSCDVQVTVTGWLEGAEARLSQESEPESGPRACGYDNQPALRLALAHCCSDPTVKATALNRPTPRNGSSCTAPSPGQSRVAQAAGGTVTASQTTVTKWCCLLVNWNRKIIIGTGTQSLSLESQQDGNPGKRQPARPPESSGAAFTG